MGQFSVEISTLPGSILNGNQQHAQGRQMVEEQHCIVRPWFFERDNGWYVQCKFGNRAILLSNSSNAAFADSLEGVAGVLSVLRDAANSGELDLPILLMTKGRA